MSDNIRGKRLFVVAFGLFFAVLVTTNLVSGLLAKYTEKSPIDETAKVAAFVFNVTDGEGSYILDLSEIRAPGDEQTYTFILENSNGNTKSEVAQEYSICISEIGSLPLVYTYNGESHVAGASVTENIYYGSLPVGISQQEYTINIKWPETENDEKYSSGSGVAHIKIDIECTQID